MDPILIATLARIAAELYQQYRNGQITKEQLAEQWDIRFRPLYLAALDEWEKAKEIDAQRDSK